MATLTFNADDLGICRGTNEGVDRVAGTGLIRAASLCVTGEAVEEGARVAARHELDLGLHFSLTLGTALTGRLRGLTDRRGRFRRLSRVYLACSTGGVVLDEVREELRAQLARVVELSGGVTHVDGHQHVHAFPVIREALLDVIGEHDLRYVRVPVDRAWDARRAPKRGFVTAMGLGLARAARRRGVSLPTRRFVGFTLYDAPDFGARMTRVLDRLAPLDHEWMLHPRVDDDRFARLNHVSNRRLPHARDEVEALLDPRLPERVRAAGFSLAGHRRAAPAARRAPGTAAID